MPVQAQNYKKLTGQGAGDPKEYILAEMSDLMSDNLLLNSNWKSGIINQQGKTTYDPVNQWTLSIDGWIYFGQMQIFVQSGNIRLYSTSSNTGTCYFKQIIRRLKNKKHLWYIHVESISGTAKATVKSGVDIPLVQGDNFIEADVENGVLQCQINLSGKGVNLVIDEMKVEEGTIFTGTQPWNEAKESMSALESYQHSLFGILDPYFAGKNTNTFEVIVMLKRPMRKSPTIKSYKAIRIGSETVTPSSVSVAYNTLGYTAIKVVLSSPRVIDNVSMIEVCLDSMDY